VASQRSLRLDQMRRLARRLGPLRLDVRTEASRFLRTSLHTGRGHSKCAPSELLLLIINTFPSCALAMRAEAQKIVTQDHISNRVAATSRSMDIADTLSNRDLFSADCTTRKTKGNVAWNSRNCSGQHCRMIGRLVSCPSRFGKP